MSIKAKLSLIFSLIVSIILIINMVLSYYSVRSLLEEKNKTQMELLVKNIAISIEHYQYGSNYIEELLGHELRTASIAVKYALNPDINHVTNEELEELSKELDIAHITLLTKEKDDIVGAKSSDPKELNLSTKEWGYWYTAFHQLFDEQQVTIPEGQKLPNYWAGPLNISVSDPNYIDKWGYFYDGTTNYIIDPYVRANQMQKFEELMGPEIIIQKILEDNPMFLEITGFNPESFGHDVESKVFNGETIYRLEQRPISFGTYHYNLGEKDISSVREAISSNQMVNIETMVNDQKVIKSFVPVQAENPYVIGIVMDKKAIEDALNQHLLRDLIISSILIFFVFAFSYFYSGYVVKPILQIINKVKEISAGHFGVHIDGKRNDELGLLTKGVNIMSSNLADYKSQLEYLAYYDVLTNLPNRRLFQEKLNQFMLEADRDESRLAVMFFDLDRFKFVNDIFGHTMGDKLLKEVAKRVKEQLGVSGTLFRIGGDEFTIILPNQTRDSTCRIADDIIQSLSSPFLIDGYEMIVTPSIGISFYPEDANNAETILQNTDIAMYRAKENGKNNYQFFVPEINESFSRKVQLEKDLHKAIENKEFILYFQPQVDIKSGEIIGAEALVRWQHPELGLIPPGVFIPLAEENGLIIPLGEWILKTACKQMKIWQDSAHINIRIAINLSVLQFQQGNLAETVTKILEETGVDPKFLELEITESIASQDAKYTIMRLEQLKNIGIQISMDDFGTGYSSLSYLKKFPIDKLKVDKSFVDDITNPEDRVMVNTIITMAHNLNLNVIAEGVETEEQLKILQEEQCDEVQGYLFSKPLPVEEFENQYYEILKNASDKVHKQN